MYTKAGRQDREPIAAAGASEVEGNERLTALTGAVLLAGLLIECYTILRIGHLLTLHVFLGTLLLGPVALKAASVLYRFTRLPCTASSAAVVAPAFDAPAPLPPRVSLGRQ